MCVIETCKMFFSPNNVNVGQTAGAASSIMQNLLVKNDVVVFTLSYCSVSERLKTFFKEEEISFYNIDIDEHELYSYLLHELKKKATSEKEPPYTYIHKLFVGGFEDVMTLYHTGKLQELIRKHRMEKYDYDLIVVGGSIAALAAANEAAILGKSVAVFDEVLPSKRGKPSPGSGGISTNAGCMLMKLMHRASLISSFCEDCKYYGWDIDFRRVGSHNWKMMMSNMQRHTEYVTNKLHDQCLSNGVKYFRSFVERFIDHHSIHARTNLELENVHTAQVFIVATSSRPKLPDFPGSQFSITADDLFYLPEKPGRTLIIGGSSTGLQCAGFLNGLGIDCTVLDSKVRLLPQYDADIVNKIIGQLKSSGVKFKLGVKDEFEIKKRVSSPNAKSADVKDLKFELLLSPKQSQAHGRHELYNTILVALGRQYSMAHMNLESLGVKFDPLSERILVNKYDRTDCHTIFAIGDISNNHSELPSGAAKEGKLLVRRMVGQDTVINRDFIPNSLLTPLEYGFCGFTEIQAKAVYGESNIQVFRKSFNPLEWELQQRNINYCYVKVICSKKDMQVIGIHFLGPNATELCQGFGLTAKLKCKKSDYDNFIAVHSSCCEEITKLGVPDTPQSNRSSTSSLISAGRRSSAMSSLI